MKIRSSSLSDAPNVQPRNLSYPTKHAVNRELTNLLAEVSKRYLSFSPSKGNCASSVISLKLLYFVTLLFFHNSLQNFTKKELEYGTYVRSRTRPADKTDRVEFSVGWSEFRIRDFAKRRAHSNRIRRVVHFSRFKNCTPACGELQFVSSVEELYTCTLTRSGIMYHYARAIQLFLFLLFLQKGKNNTSFRKPRRYKARRKRLLWRRRRLPRWATRSKG